jgi:hypothetical protein
MGANAVTTVPVYVAGEVLTAADLNITNSGIPVFASTVERDAAFGGTGEKTLAEGQYAYLENTNATQFYDGAAWQSLTGGGIAIFNETQAAGTNGGSSTTGSFLIRTLNTTVVNTITGCSIASSVITLPAGTYYVSAQAPFLETTSLKLRLRNTTDSTDAIIGMTLYMSSGAGAGNTGLLNGYFTIAGTKDFELQYRVSTSQATFGLGVGANFGVSEIYSQIQIEKVA